MKPPIPEKKPRLFFIDAIRAWAILMMLQGHFIDGLLDPVFRDPEHWVFRLWLYIRGITAPVFFTVSGFIFIYLLKQTPGVGLDNTRVKKGIRRGLQLILIGYLLRLNIPGLFQGQLYEAFYQVDVLHCIGLSLICLVALYSVTARTKSWVFPLLLTGVTLVLFLLESIYQQFSYSILPRSIAHYFTTSGGSVFTLFPWLGYATAGGTLAVLFTRCKNTTYLYPYAISIATLLGYGLVFHSSGFFVWLYTATGIELFQAVSTNNYLFMRLGDVFWVFALCMALRHWLAHRTVVRIGASTLPIYILHFMVLYGSFTGWGLYRLFHHTLPPTTAILGALTFMVGCTCLALCYTRYKETLNRQGALAVNTVKHQAIQGYTAAVLGYKWRVLRVRVRVQRWLRD